jgi:hypothetical protein
MGRASFPRLAAAVAVAVTAALALTLAGHEAFGCPDCATARAVQAAVFDGDFFRNLTLVILPLLVLAAIGVLLHGVGREPPGQIPAADRGGPKPRT